MPRDASGAYTLPTNDSSPAAPRNVIRSSDFNELTGDYAMALTDSLSRSGDGAMLANLDFGGFAAENATNIPALAANTMPVDNAGGTARETKTFPQVRNILDIPVYAATRTALKALDTTNDILAYLKEDGREGIFEWTAGDFSAQITADTQEAIYLKADAIASTAGAWVRVFDGYLSPEWFGAVGDNGTTDNLNALTALYSLAQLVAGAVYLRPGDIYHVKTGTLTIPEDVVTFADNGASIIASGAGTVTKLGTTAMYRPMGGSQARGLFVDVVKGSGASTLANPHSYNFFRVQDDKIDGEQGGGSKVNGFFINHTFGGTGTKGGRHAFESRLNMTAASDAGSVDRNYCAAAFFASGDVNDGGTLGSEKGSLFGMNPQARLRTSGATNFLNVTSGECNVGIVTGASSQMRTGLSIVGLSDPVRGYTVDAGLSISNTGVSGAYFLDGILLGAQNGRPALTSDSTVLRVAGTTTAANGIDFNGMTFTTDILRATNVRLRNSQFIMSASNASITIGNPSASNTPFMDFRANNLGSTYDARLIASNGGASDGQGDLRAVAANFVSNKHRPFADNTYSLGDASFRWSQLFAGTATINTSDERLKTPFRGFSDAEKEALLACLAHIGIYQWLDAVAEKGEDDARLHAGVPAQRCIAEFESRGLDPWRYAFFCRDRKIETVQKTVTAKRQAMETVEIEKTVIEVQDGVAVMRKVSETVEQPKFIEIPVVDESGLPITVMSKERDGVKIVTDEDGVEHEVDVFRYFSVPMVHHEPVMEEFETTVEEQTETEDFIYGIRHSELIMAILAVSG